MSEQNYYFYPNNITVSQRKEKAPKPTVSNNLTIRKPNKNTLFLWLSNSKSKYSLINNVNKIYKILYKLKKTYAGSSKEQRK